VLGSQLSLRTLPADPDAFAPEARARQALLQLPVVQQLLHGGGGLGAPALQHCLLMYGGVAGEGWYTDLHVLTVVERTGGDTRVAWQQVPCTGERPPNSLPPAGRLALAAGWLPLMQRPRCPAWCRRRGAASRQGLCRLRVRQGPAGGVWRL
jgi:hypothetical protein